MKKYERKVLGNSNVTNIIKVPLANVSNLKKEKTKELEGISIKIENLSKENEKLKYENDVLKSKCSKEQNIEEKFNKLIEENKKIEENFKILKEEFFKKQNEYDQTNKKNSVNTFSKIEQNLKESFNSLEEDLNFFKNEANMYSEKLSEKQKDYDNLYIEYISQNERLVFVLKENFSLRQEIGLLNNRL